MRVRWRRKAELKGGCISDVGPFPVDRLWYEIVFGGNDAVEKGLRILFDDEHGAMRGREECVFAHVIEELDQRIVEVLDVEQPNGLEMDAELEPGERFGNFLKGADA